MVLFVLRLSLRSALRVLNQPLLTSHSVCARRFCTSIQPLRCSFSEDAYVEQPTTLTDVCQPFDIEHLPSRGNPSRTVEPSVQRMKVSSLEWWQRWYAGKMHGEKKDGRMNKVFALFERMIAQGVDPTVVHFSIAIAAAGKSGDLEKAFDYFTRMVSAGVKPNQITFCTLFDSFAVSANGEFALAKTRELHVQLRAFDVELNRAVCSSLIRVYATHGALDEALGVLDDAGKENCSPCVLTFNLLFGVFGRAQRLGDVFELYEKMLKCGAWANFATHAALIDACANASENDRSFALAKVATLRAELTRMRGRRLRFAEYDVLVKAYANHGQLEPALGVLEEMLAACVLPDEQIFEVLAAALLHRCELDDALRIVALIDKSGVKLSSSIAAALLCSCERSMSNDADVEKLKKICRFCSRIDLESVELGDESKRSAREIVNEILAKEHGVEENHCSTDAAVLSDTSGGDYERDLCKFEKAFQEILNELPVRSSVHRRRSREKR